MADASIHILQAYSHTAICLHKRISFRYGLLQTYERDTSRDAIERR
jgi:hypothetical protein